MKNKRVMFLPILLLTMLLLALGATTALGASGAIWTTDGTGNDVNQNVWYPDKYSVYLNGGPSADGSSHLPPGTYYIKVTDPSGNRLGKVSPSYTVDNNGRFLFTDSSTQKQLPSGEVLVQLYAATKFTPTPNNGGVYKAWISTDPTFKNSAAKTDNFKVKVSQEPYLIIDKFEDLNKDGIWDTNEKNIPWSVTVTNTTLGYSWVQTLVDGHWEGFVDPGEYTITEKDGAPEWIHTTPSEVHLTIGTKGTYKATFGNHHLANIIVRKFSDLNSDTLWNENDFELTWNGNITPILGAIQMHYEAWIEPGTYTVSEETKLPEWVPTTVNIDGIPTGKKNATDVTLVAGKTTTVDFGNHQLAHIIVRKFNDFNANKLWDSVNEVEMSWTGNIQPGSEITMQYDRWIEPGNYTISEDTKLPDWVPTTVNIDGVPTGGIISTPVKLVAGSTTTVDFGNRQLAYLHIVKFYDYNGDGILNGNDYKMTWPVTLAGTDFLGGIINLPINLQNGDWANYLDPGDYTVSEKLPKDPGWTPTRNVTVPVQLDPGDAKDVLFGNRYVGIGGHTHGFWGNNNGQEIFMSDGKYLKAINSLPLVDGSGNYVIPFLNYEAFAVWNQEATGKNAANMLSCQLATMVLNGTAGTDIGFIDINGYVLVDPNTPVIVDNVNVNNNGVVKVRDLITAAIQTLEAHPNTIDTSSEREYQNGLEKLIDAANQDNARVYLPEFPPSPIFD